MERIEINPVGIKIEAFTIAIDLMATGEQLYNIIVEMTGENSCKLMFRGRGIFKDKNLQEQGLKGGCKVLLVKEKDISKKEETPAANQSTPLEILISMGYPVEVCDRALINVGFGYGAVQKAIDWIERNKKIFEIEEKLIDFTSKPESKKIETKPTVYKRQKTEEYPDVVIETSESQISTVFCWGNGATGQLGLGDIQISHSPFNVRSLAGVKMATISCGAHHTVGLSANGNIYTWGRYLYPTEDNSVKYGNKRNPSLLESVKAFKFSKVSTGTGHTIALDILGQV